MNIEHNTEIIKNIRRLADNKGIKHCKIAEACGMTKQEFSRMLAGKKVLRACYMPLIARAIGCECGDLFADDPKKEAG